MEKMEIEVTTTMNNTQKAAEEIAVRLIGQINSGGGFDGIAIGSSHDIHGGRSSKTLLEGATGDHTQPRMSNGGTSLPVLLKQNMHRRSEDPQGLARSVSELR
jgi:hypothetical protein